jgi:hypothetical protein
LVITELDPLVIFALNFFLIKYYKQEQIKKLIVINSEQILISNEESIVSLIKYWSVNNFGVKISTPTLHANEAFLN